MRKSLVALALIALPTGASCDVEDDDLRDEPTAVPRIEESVCRFRIPPDLGLRQGEDYRCGDLVVYEDRRIEGSPTIRLHYIQIDGAASDIATIYLDGGPGGDGNSILRVVANGESGVREVLLAGGDFLSISQRGTGLSSPALMCEDPQASAGACAADVSSLGDLAAYNTANNADDIDELRQLLGYEALNLYGISYGSRLALEVLRRHPQNIRAAIAGGTVPAQVVWPAETSASFYGALGALATSCAEDPACSEAYGDLRATMLQGIDDLNAEPAMISVFGQQLPVDGSLYAALVFQLLYSRAAYGILPLVISDLAERRTDRVREPLVEIFAGRFATASIAQGMYYSVVCGELFNPPPAPSVFDDATKDVPPLVVGAVGSNYLSLQAACAEWPLGRPMPELSEIVTSDVPTLLSNGKLDPITPPRFGGFAKEGLVNAKVVNFANSGHGSTLQSACGVQVLADFLAEPSGALDSSCADTLSIEFQMPSSAAAMPILDIEQIRRDIELAPTPPWIRARTADWSRR